MSVLLTRSHLYSSYHTTTNERNYQNLLLISFIILIFSCNQNTKTEYKIHKDGLVSEAQITLRIHAGFLSFYLYLFCMLLCHSSFASLQTFVNQQTLDCFIHSMLSQLVIHQSLIFIPLRNSNFPCLHIFMAARSLPIADGNIPKMNLYQPTIK